MQIAPVGILKQQLSAALDFCNTVNIQITVAHFIFTFETNLRSCLIKHCHGAVLGLEYGTFKNDQE
jgi:hypothetical protein